MKIFFLKTLITLTKEFWLFRSRRHCILAVYILTGLPLTASLLPNFYSKISQPLSYKTFTNLLHGFWDQDVSRVCMKHAKFFFEAVFNPFILQWKYSWDLNIKFIFLSSVILQLPEFLFSVCSAYSLSSNALKAICRFIDNWIIIPFSQHNSGGPCLTVHKDVPQCTVTLQRIRALVPCEFSNGKHTLQQQHESILESLAEARFKCTSLWWFENLRIAVQW